MATIWFIGDNPDSFLLKVKDLCYVSIRRTASYDGTVTEMGVVECIVKGFFCWRSKTVFISAHTVKGAVQISYSMVSMIIKC